MKRKVLVIDTETGGISAERNSILSIGACVWHDGAIEKEWTTLIDEGDIQVDQDVVPPAKKAFEVNNLSLELIERDGRNPYETVTVLEEMLAQCDMRKDVQIVAHNAAFDFAFLERLYRLAGKDVRDRFSRRLLCTQTGALMLQEAGLVNLPGGSSSLENLCKLWSIPLIKHHDALTDARACAVIYTKELRIMGKAVGR